MGLRERWVLPGFIEVSGRAGGVKVFVIVSNPRFNGEGVGSLKEVVREYAEKINKLMEELAMIARLGMGADSVGIEISVVKNYDFVPIDRVADVVRQSRSEPQSS